MAFFANKDRENSAAGLPKGIRIRPANADDEYASFEVMRRTMNYDMSWSHHAVLRNHLRTSPNVSFWLAEETPRFSTSKVVGYARSIVRDRVWCLTEFFILPGFQRQGVGRSLLDRCIAEGNEIGVDTRLVLASLNPAADSLYIRHAACIPRVPMLLFSGAVSRLRPPNESNRVIHDAVLPYIGSPETGGYEASSTTESDRSQQEIWAEPLILSNALQAEFDALDRDIVGYARPDEHRLWAQLSGGIRGPARVFRRGNPGKDPNYSSNPIVGYTYLGPTASGPALALNAEDLPRMISHVAAVFIMLSKAESDWEFLRPAEQYWAVAGTNEVVIRWLLGCGWQITFQYLYMSSSAIGRLDQYVCFNPLYVL